MSRHQRIEIDITNPDKLAVQGFEVRYIAVWHTGPVRTQINSRGFEEYDPDKWVLRVNREGDQEDCLEEWFDHLFPARMQRKRAIDKLTGILKRKVRVRVGKRNVKQSELDHRVGTAPGQGKETSRRWAAQTYRAVDDARVKLKVRNRHGQMELRSWETHLTKTH